MRLIELTQTCEACPSQWDGRLEDGRTVYIRYRHQTLSVEVGPTDASYVDGGDWITVFERDGVVETRGRGIDIEDVCTMTGLTLAPEAGPFRPKTADV